MQASRGWGDLRRVAGEVTSVADERLGRGRDPASIVVH